MGKEAKDRLHYLKPEQQQLIEEWVEGILPLMEKHPRMKDVDLVIEGGVGTGSTLLDIARRLFPDALYVGTDIAERLMTGKSRINRAIDKKTLSGIQAANDHPSFGMRGAVIHGNCFDTELVRDIAQKAGKRNPILATFNALNALLDRKMNPWDRKDESDRITLEDMVLSNSPYVAQLHVGADWDDEGATSLSSRYCRLESAANSVGWITERFDVGLLLLRP